MNLCDGPVLNSSISMSGDSTSQTLTDLREGGGWTMARVFDQEGELDGPVQGFDG